MVKKFHQYQQNERLIFTDDI